MALETDLLESTNKNVLEMAIRSRKFSQKHNYECMAK